MNTSMNRTSRNEILLSLNAAKLTASSTNSTHVL